MTKPFINMVWPPHISEYHSIPLPTRVLVAQVRVKLTDECSGNEFDWNKARFLNRQVHMQEMFQEFDETGKVPVVSPVGVVFRYYWYPAVTFCSR